MDTETSERLLDPHAAHRARMVAEQLAARDITDPLVLAAMGEVPRHAFIPVGFRRYAYRDHPVPIGWDQTISQPWIVALMTQLARLHPGDRVLEVGTGSGYQTAILAEIGVQVYTIEIVDELADRAATTLKSLGYVVHARVGDGYQGWPEYAPFDAILVTAAPAHVPPPLLEQLAPGGRLIIPVGGDEQALKVIVRTAEGFAEADVVAVRFVPMTGEAAEE